MKFLLTIGLVAGHLAAFAQTPITITQAQFTATGNTIDRYQPAATTGLTNPGTGPNQSWDYRSLTPQGAVVAGTYTNVGTSPLFAGTVRTYNFNSGPLGVLTTAYEGFDLAGFGQLGSFIVPQTFSLTATTGGANDVITVPLQTLVVQTLQVPLPMTSTTRTGRTKRVVTRSNITVQSYALNQAPLLYVQRITTLDSVVGWGTLRIPVAGNSSGSAPIPVLLERRSFVEQDSFYLNGQPAPAQLLTALGQTQGTTSSTYRQRFFRQNAAQPVLTIAYADNRYATPTGAAYSAEQSIPLGTQAARTVTGGGLLAWPNPAVAGQPLQFALAASAPGQPLRICLRDGTGRVVARLAGANGQSTTLPGLPAGLYLAEAETADGTRFSRRLVLE